MKNIFLWTVTLLLFNGCSNGYNLKTTNVDSADMKKYPKGMVINGYTLPAEPNKTLNEKTLLGVDSNKNGIRDDVERFIIISNSKLPKDKYPKTWTAIKIQAAKANFAFIKNQTKANAYKTSRTINCQEHFIRHAIKKHGFTGLKARRHFINKYSSFNTARAFHMIYRSDKVSSWYGNERHKFLFVRPSATNMKNDCDVDLTKLGEW